MNSFLAAEVKLPVRTISRKKRICFASIPVSYTHLDVYKRQGFNCFAHQPAQRHPLLRRVDFGQPDRVVLPDAAVAKRHLDVYKRQPLDVMETTGITLPFPSAAATSQSAEPAPSNVRRI